MARKSNNNQKNSTRYTQYDVEDFTPGMSSQGGHMEAQPVDWNQTLLQAQAGNREALEDFGILLQNLHTQEYRKRSTFPADNKASWLLKCLQDAYALKRWKQAKNFSDFIDHDPFRNPCVTDETGNPVAYTTMDLVRLLIGRPGSDEIGSAYIRGLGDCRFENHAIITPSDTGFLLVIGFGYGKDQITWSLPGRTIYTQVIHSLKCAQAAPLGRTGVMSGTTNFDAYTGILPAGHKLMDIHKVEHTLSEPIRVTMVYKLYAAFMWARPGAAGKFPNVEGDELKRYKTMGEAMRLLFTIPGTDGKKIGWPENGVDLEWWNVCYTLLSTLEEKRADFFLPNRMLDASCGFTLENVWNKKTFMECNAKRSAQRAANYKRIGEERKEERKQHASYPSRAVPSTYQDPLAGLSTPPDDSGFPPEEDEYDDDDYSDIP